MVVFTSFFFLFVFQFAAGLSHVIHENRESLLENVFDRQRIEFDALLPMRIGLRQNADALANSERWLMAVSDPKSPTYGRHWSQEDVIKAFAPADETLSAVKKWLVENGIKDFTHSENKQWLAFDLPAHQAEELLQTKYFEHRTSNGRFEVSADAYSLPAALRDHVDFVMPGLVLRDVTGRTERSRRLLNDAKKNLPLQPLANRPYPSPAHKRTPLSSSRPSSTYSESSLPTGSGLPQICRADDLICCAHSVTAACIRVLYNFTVPDPKAPVSRNNSMGIYEVFSLRLTSITRQEDLNKFFQYYTDIPADTSPTFYSIDGAITRPNQTLGWRSPYRQFYSWQEVLSESTLDLQIAYPIVYPQTLTVFQSDDPHWAYREFSNFNEGLLNDFLDAIDGSYCTYTALNETGNDPLRDPKYPDPRPHGYGGCLQCGVFKPTNVISISYGKWAFSLPWSYQRRQCLEFLKLALQGVSVFSSSGDFGVGPCTPNGAFGEHHPASCPWLTSVGETYIVPGKTGYAPEQGMSESGGGFSNLHDRPSYQNEAVSKYFRIANLSLPYYHNGNFNNASGRYNRNGRGYPDLSAVGEQIVTFITGEYYKTGGTSASTPLVASLFNRVIEERIRAGKNRLGFINPVLYQNSAALNDILMGINYNAECGAGFPCAPGWDPVSGLGTPNYPKLLDVFLKLP